MKATDILLGKSEMSGESIKTRSLPISCYPAVGKRIAAWVLASGCLLLATPAAMAFTPSQYPLFLGSANMANVLLIMDNSNSMDEVPTGGAVCDLNALGNVIYDDPLNIEKTTHCGSRSNASKSELARTAAIGLIANYTGKINLGLMAYQQDAQSLAYLYNSPYDASYDSTLIPAKKNSIPNPSNPGHYIYYDVALPFYLDDVAANKPANPANPLDPLNYLFCYTGDALTFPSTVGYDITVGRITYHNSWYYRCFGSKNSVNGGNGESDGVISPTITAGPITAAETALGYSGLKAPYYFFYPTDSDLALGIHNFGKILTQNYVGRAWFSSSSTGGKGYLHLPIAELDAAQATKLNTKLGRAQFTVAGKATNLDYPLQNAGNTPIEGTLNTAERYFTDPANLVAAQGGAQAPLPGLCGKNFAVLLTDGLPSTASNGVNYSDPADAAIDAVKAASDLRASSAGVETYVIGFGVNSPVLTDIALAGGTTGAYSATDQGTLNTALDLIFSNILSKTGSAASVATSSSNLQTESRVFQAKFSSTDWSGQLLQYKLSNLPTLLNPNTHEWDAGSKINSQAAAARVIITKGDTDGVAFRWGNLTTTAITGQQAYLNKDASGTVDGLGSTRVDYLRGDATNEVTAGGNFRARARAVGTNGGTLGDIVNSSPWLLGAPAAGYSDVDYPGYAAFRAGALGRMPVVYVGGNDGMLHGFDASLDFSNALFPAGVPTGTAGNEVLAYVPSAVYPNLSQLTGQTYNQGTNHKYFVDGSPMAADANFGGAWHTVLVGSLGGGGKGYYALDVTSPANFSEAHAADMLLWEFTESDDADVGYVYNNPPARSNGQAKQIVRMANNKWAVILGNGYNSGAGTAAPGKAVLYILFINDGIDGWSAGDFVKLIADDSGDNGLSTPVPFDSNRDGYVDTVYAGDLKGNMWKFDVSNPVPTGNWQVALSGQPLFTARDNANNPQPITWPPEVTFHPDGGQVVLFGTGKYLENGDNTTNGTQTFYSIHDDGAAVTGRSVLTPTAITTTDVTTTSGASITYRTSAKGCPDLTTTPPTACPATPKGCYVDLPTLGERSTGIPKRKGSNIFFNTFIPATTCNGTPTGWLMDLDYLSCTTPDNVVFDTNNDGVIDSSDTPVAGVQVGAGLGGTSFIDSSIPGGGAGVAFVPLADGGTWAGPVNTGSYTHGRVFWREIVQ